MVVDVFTFDCINCKHVVPELKRLNAEHSPDLAIVGIYSPETPYERQRENVVAHLRAQGITWPVAVDNDFALWKAYGVEYWPTQLISTAADVYAQPSSAKGTLTAWPQRDNSAFAQVVHHRLVVRGTAGEATAVRGKIGKGWIVAFCTPHVCAPGRVDLTLPHSGAVTLDVQAIRIDDAVAPVTTISVDASARQRRRAIAAPSDPKSNTIMPSAKKTRDSKTNGNVNTPRTSSAGPSNNRYAPLPLCAARVRMPLKSSTTPTTTISATNVIYRCKTARKRR